LEQRLESIAAQTRQVEASATKHVELAGIAQSMQEFCQRVSRGLEQASFEHKRQLIELLIDRVVVTNEEVEIRYVIPTSPNSEHTRFCHLRSNYFDAKGNEPVPNGVFLRRPASRVGLGEFHRIHLWCRGHNRDQFRHRWWCRQGGCLPALV
jgi:hypothetical protein